MGDEDRGRHLPQRVRGEARGGSAPSAAPVLSEEMRQRIQAAIRAERAGTTAEGREPSTEVPRRGTPAESAGAVMSPVGEKIEKANGHQKRHVKPGHAGKREHVGKSEQVGTSEHAGKPESYAKAEAVLEPEHAVKDGPAVKAERLVMVGSAVEPAHAAEAEPAIKSRPDGKVPAHHKPAMTGPAGPEPPDESAQTGPEGRRLGWVRTVAFFLVLVAVGSLAVVVSRHIGNSSTGNDAAALQRAEVQTQAQAASWVAQQVDPTDVVSCDQAMCAALRADRFPAGKLVVLEPTSNPPVTSAVVVVTAAVRSMFGSSIDDAWAPDVLATIGSGAAEITIRLMAPHGALAYQAALSAGVPGRKEYGNVLLGSNRIQLSQTAENQINAGQVDPRLVLAIASLAIDEPIDVAQFENLGPGVSGGLPLRFADLSVNGNPANMSGSAYVSALDSYLSSQRDLLGPVSGEKVLSGGQDVFRVEFPAPSPLSSSGTPASP
jgi:hypothetical protein